MLTNPPATARAEAVPLFVDLDGTLVTTDTLWESLLLLLRQRFLAIFLLPFWLLAGKAHFKRRVAERVRINPQALPYNEEVVGFLREERARGREIFLATGTDLIIAEPIAAHLGLFDGVLASDGATNITSENKRKRIQELAGSAGYAYIGNSSADFPAWEAAAAVLVVPESEGLLRRVRRRLPVARVFERTSGGVFALVKALRPHQWAKNVLLFVPLFMAHHMQQLDELRACLIAFVCFGLAASAGYLFNDLFDLEADRVHPLKRNRPLARGAVAIPTAIATVFINFATALVLAGSLLPLPFLGFLLLYTFLTTSYSLYFKRKLLADVLLLAGLYTLRVLAGASAIDVIVSPWLLAFSMFIFLSLAFAKRGAELILMAGAEVESSRRRAYRFEDLDLVRTMGASAGYMAVLVLCLYLNSQEVVALYENVELLWGICPILLYWLSRVWFLVGRGQLPGDPVTFAVKDPISLLCGAMILVIVLSSAIDFSGV